MITQSKEKIEKASRLFALIQSRLQMEKEEKELKEYFKGEITDGVLDAGSIVITIQSKSRTSLDRDGLEKKLGDELKLFEKITEYEQVSVMEKK